MSWSFSFNILLCICLSVSLLVSGFLANPRVPWAPKHSRTYDLFLLSSNYVTYTIPNLFQGLLYLDPETSSGWHICLILLSCWIHFSIYFLLPSPAGEGVGMGSWLDLSYLDVKTPPVTDVTSSPAGEAFSFVTLNLFRNLFFLFPQPGEVGWGSLFFSGFTLMLRPHLSLTWHPPRLGRLFLLFVLSTLCLIFI